MFIEEMKGFESRHSQIEEKIDRIYKMGDQAINYLEKQIILRDVQKNKIYI